MLLCWPQHTHHLLLLMLLTTVLLQNTSNTTNATMIPIAEEMFNMVEGCGQWGWREGQSEFNVGAESSCRQVGDMPFEPAVPIA